MRARNMRLPYKSIEFVPDYEQYFNGVKIGLLFFPFYRNNPTKKVTGWLIDEIVERSQKCELIVGDSDENPIVLDGTYWALGRPSGSFIRYIRRKHKEEEIIFRNCEWKILKPLPDGYCFDE